MFGGFLQEKKRPHVPVLYISPRRRHRCEDIARIDIKAAIDIRRNNKHYEIHHHRSIVLRFNHEFKKLFLTEKIRRRNNLINNSSAHRRMNDDCRVKIDLKVSPHAAVDIFKWVSFRFI